MRKIWLMRCLAILSIPSILYHQGKNVYQSCIPKSLSKSEKIYLMQWKLTYLAYAWLYPGSVSWLCVIQTYTYARLTKIGLCDLCSFYFVNHLANAILCAIYFITAISS